MIYGNLIYLLVVMVILASGAEPEHPVLPGPQVLAIFGVKLWLFRQTIRFFRNRKAIKKVGDYFSVEKVLAILALVLFAGDVYLLDLRYFLKLLPFTRLLPSLVELAGIAVFLFYLLLLWVELKPDYEKVVGTRKKALVHLGEKLRICLALVLPWLIANFLYDILMLISNETFRDFWESVWGQALFFLVIFSGAVIWFPAVLVRLFGCTAMPDGELRRHIEEFCFRQKIRFGEICLWPIVEGKVLTAGVVGFLGRYRYLLITPALIQSLSEEELEAVVAHEIGHVKKHHLFLYILLFLGFALLLQVCIQPLIGLMLTSGIVYDILYSYRGDPETLMAIIAGGPFVVLALLYFRYLFGYFMRNFERQADNYSFQVMGRVEPLISVFKKIALMSGKDRDEPCWHHFSIGQRIENLLNLRDNGMTVKGQDQKIQSSLSLYFLAVAALFFLTLQVGGPIQIGYDGQLMAEEMILKKIEHDPNNPLWHQFHGDLLVGRGKYEQAITAFERSLELDPDNPESLNNLAWLLLTVDDEKLHDPKRALALALKAAEIRERSHILDTLAEAYWQNGMTDLASETEQRALENSRGDREHYRKQLEKFEKGGRS